MDPTSPNFRLRIDAHALIQLGEQLITDDEQALLELVKNSYDADAEWACIRVISTYVPSDDDPVPATAIGLIEIEDNGQGMNRQQLENGWLTISVSLKRDQKLKRIPSKRFRRYPLGDKGLGRLGTMKLGNLLSVRTWDSPKEDGWQVDLQWSEIRSGIPLEAVPVVWKRVPPIGTTGTTVRIFGLRDPQGWRQARRLDRLKANYRV